MKCSFYRCRSNRSPPAKRAALDKKSHPGKFVIIKSFSIFTHTACMKSYYTTGSMQTIGQCARPIKHCISLSDLQRMLSPSQSAEAGKDHASTQQPLKGGNLSAVEQDPSESLHAEPLELHEYDYSCEEQMVPASVPYQPYRYDLRYPG